MKMTTAMPYTTEPNQLSDECRGNHRNVQENAFYEQVRSEFLSVSSSFMGLPNMQFIQPTQ